MDIGIKLRVKRNSTGLTQEALANASGVSLETVGKIERDEVSPSIDTLEKIAGGLGCSLEEMLCEPEDQEKSLSQVSQ